MPDVFEDKILTIITATRDIINTVNDKKYQENTLRHLNSIFEDIIETARNMKDIDTVPRSVSVRNSTNAWRDRMKPLTRDWKGEDPFYMESLHDVIVRDP